MEKETDSVGAIVLSGCHRFYAWLAAEVCNVRSTMKAYVKERFCRGIFLQVHLVHVFQSFDRHGDVGSMASAFGNVVCVIASMIYPGFGVDRTAGV